MSKQTKSKPCELCKQPVEIKGFSLDSTEGKLHFCCAGCLSIYQLINDEKLNNHFTSNKNNSEDI